MNEEQGSQRKHYTAEQKFKMVKDALKSGMSIAEVQKRYGVSSTAFYRWQEEFFEGALDRFRNGKAGPTTSELREIADLKCDVDKMKNVIAEITSENIILKKTFGR
jgi:transposase-like protein